MEIRSINNDIKNEYPKMEQVNKNQLLDNLPRKWVKVGLSSFVIEMVMKNTVFASEIISGNIVFEPAGVEPTPINTAPAFVRRYIIDFPDIQICLAFIFLLTLISILITKIKAKKQSKPKKVKLWLKVLSITSIVAFVLNFIIHTIINQIY